MPVTIDHLPGRNLHYQGQEWLYFSGTGYLGLAKHPRYLAALHAGLEKYGGNFGGSRRSNLQLAIFAEAEAFLAEWLGAEAVLTSSSGSLSGQLLIKLLEREGQCYYSPAIHPALIGTGHPYPGSYQDWIEMICQHPFPKDQPVFLLTSSLDPLTAELYPLDWVHRLKPDRKYYLIIDDSHGLGVLGPKGKGIIEFLPKAAQVEYLLLSSMGKALATPGGLIAGSRSTIQELWKSPFFGGASPVIPAYLYAFMQSRDLIRTQQARLQANIRFVEQQIQDMTRFSHIEGHPVFHLKVPRLAARLQEHQVLLSSFPYPSEKDPLVHRIVINAAHTPGDLEKLTTLINQIA